MADAETMMLKLPNPALCRLLGYTEREPNTMTMPDIIRKTPRRTLAEFESAGPRRQRHSKIIRCLRKDGGVVCADITCLLPPSMGGSAAVGVIRDITERKRAQEYARNCSARRQGINLVAAVAPGAGPAGGKTQKVTDGIVRLFDADFCRIWLIRPGDLCQGKCIHAAAEDGPHVCRYRDRCLHLLASSGRYTHIDGQAHRRVPFGCYKIGRIASGEDHKFLTNDAPNDPRVHNHQWASELGLVSFAGYHSAFPAETPWGCWPFSPNTPSTRVKTPCWTG